MSETAAPTATPTATPPSVSSSGAATAHTEPPAWDDWPAVPEGRWALAPETGRLIDALRQHLDHHATELRDRWSDRSERWQDSDKGGDVDTWIESLGDLVDTLDDLDREI